MSIKIINSNLRKILSKKYTNSEANRFVENLKEHIQKKNFFIIDLKENNEQKIKDKTIFLSSFLGKTVSQDMKKTKVVEIKPNLKMLKKNKFSLKRNIRYHQTNTGGSIHTDGPQLLKTPNILIMSCINNAKKGGDTLIVDIRKIFNKIKNNKPKIIRELSKKYYFETRGFNFRKDFLKKPILTKKKREVSFRYMKEYIVTGYEKAKKNMNISRIEALDYLDKALNSKKNQIKLKMKKGNLIVINNKFTAHGRTNFIIDKRHPRKFLRVWVN